jgi:hypothetical protein
LGQSVGARGAAPAGTGVHVPGDPGAWHVWQAPSQLVLQQRPSTQKPLWQSDAHAQACPFACGAAPEHVVVGMVGTSLPASDTRTAGDPQPRTNETPRTKNEM